MRSLLVADEHAIQPELAAATSNRNKRQRDHDVIPPNAYQ